jgi:hypothetical protein
MAQGTRFIPVRSWLPKLFDISLNILRQIGDFYLIRNTCGCLFIYKNCYYGLTGNHVRTTNNLHNDLMKRFWDGKGYSIPRCVIIKDGLVVEKNALRPSDGQKLYDQIGKYL